MLYNRTLAIGIGFIMMILPGCSAHRPSNVGAGELSPCPSTPNCVSTLAEDETHSIEPLTFSGAPQEAMENVKKTAASMKRTRIVAEKPGYLHVEYTTGFWRFVDDVEFVIDEENSVVHFRSASRIGKSDLGVNRERMERFRRIYNGLK